MILDHLTTSVPCWFIALLLLLLRAASAAKPTGEGKKFNLAENLMRSLIDCLVHINVDASNNVKQLSECFISTVRTCFNSVILCC